MSNKSYVTLEQRKCLVCGKDYDTGSILLDKRLKPTFEHKTLTGVGLCPDDEKLHKDGFIALVAVDESKTEGYGSSIKPEDAYRTGTMAHIRRTVARKVFNVEIPDNLPMMFCDPEVIETLAKMAPKDEK